MQNEAPMGARRDLLRRHGLPMALCALLCALCFGAGILVRPLLLGTDYGNLTGKASLEEKDLDRVMGTYTLDGKTYKVTAREAILQSSSLELAKSANGSYNVPTADSVMAVARNAIMLHDAEEKDVSVSDEEVAAFAESQMGSSDFASIATQYGMDEESAKELIRQSATLAKLRERVVGTTVGEPPAAPTAPDDGNEEAASADYAAYIIGLAGDEWNAEAGTWASEDGPYAQALKGYSVTKDSATYGAANAAYYVAYEAYSSTSTSAATEWTNYVNNVLCNSQFAVSSLVS